jgi:ABC-type glutathione transport system ATPase component
VDGVSFSLDRGQTLGIVGESGSGKSTLAKLALRLIKPDSGDVLYAGKSVLKASRAEIKNFHRQVQVVFQEPFASLDPRMTVADILKEPYLIQGEKNKSLLKDETARLLKNVELNETFLTRRPHQMSGGECQRVAIARALSTNPSLIVCDEAVASLDVVTQAQILNLLLKLQKEKGVAYLFISHDLKVVRHLSDEVLVMKDGKILEKGSRDDIFYRPKHPYTSELVNFTR